MLKFDSSYNPTSLVKTLIGQANHVRLERMHGGWWMSAFTGHACVRLPGSEIEGSIPDLDGGLGEPFLRSFRLLIAGMHSFSIQADQDGIEFYDEDQKPMFRVPRIGRVSSWDGKTEALTSDPWDFSHVIALNPKTLAAAAKGMGTPDKVYVHFTPSPQGLVNDRMRVSALPFAGNHQPHGFVMPIALSKGEASEALAVLAGSSDRAAAGVKAKHPWAIEPVEPVKPVAPVGKKVAGAT